MKTFRHALQGDAITITAELALHRQTTVEEALGQARLLVRSGAGARFLQTQPCRDIDILRRYMQGMVELKMTWNYSVIVNLAPLPSAELMREVASIPGVSGINLLCMGNPESVIDAIKSSGL